MWIITTLILGIVAIAAIILNVAQQFFAKQEGRFFIRKGFGGTGLDLVRI